MVEPVLLWALPTQFRRPEELERDAMGSNKSDLAKQTQNLVFKSSLQADT